MKLLKYIFLLTGIALVSFSSSVLADWTLSPTDSSINFMSVKNAAVTEVHQFRNVSGSVTDNGDVKISIDLTSVDTAISIRDDRMKEMLFETGLFPVATLSATVDSDALSGLSAGKTMPIEAEFDLDLHGKKQLLTANLQVTGLENGGLQVNSINPIVIDSTAFKLDGGVAALQKVAKLNSIATSVPVNVQLFFMKKN
ncbi:YceI family protein [Photobacterium frigidiphilum]|uniref:YceI family protein n=1 Tax=Photobacterium frigidiphilum TaxID=264736 RepID=A0A2T3J913_9GAMM|nr:YceI family protein [Photobacterium frigidiphilum]PSU45285.1 YceI family protein [Photobacterium frigidiphilum]